MFAACNWKLLQLIYVLWDRKLYLGEGILLCGYKMCAWFVFYQKLQSSLSSDHRLPELVIMVKQLPSSADSEEAKTLAQSIDVLVTQHAETIQQVAARQMAVDDRLRRWTCFDDDYRKLVAALTALQSLVDSTKTLVAEDAIATIGNVSVCGHT